MAIIAIANNFKELVSIRICFLSLPKLSSLVHRHAIRIGQ
jgi:hypothetical protein